MTRFEGRRVFSDPPTRRELEEFAQSATRTFEGLAERRTWRELPTVRSGTPSASLDCALPVDTSDGGTVRVQLPPADSRFGGRELAINRLSALGTITLTPPNGATIDASLVAVTLPAVVGYFVVEFDGANFLRCQAGTASAGGGAPTTAEYITASADATLSAERVLTDTASVTWDFTTPGQAKANAVGGSASITQVVVNFPFPASLRQVATVTDASVTATDKIMVELAGVAETVDNSSDSVDLLSLRALPGTGTFEVQASFLTPAAGAFTLNYLRAA